MSSKDTNKTFAMYLKSNNKEIMIGYITDEIIKKKLILFSKYNRLNINITDSPK